VSPILTNHFSGISMKTEVQLIPTISISTVVPRTGLGGFSTRSEFDGIAHKLCEQCDPGLSNVALNHNVCSDWCTASFTLK
jgi:hypothetical protein